MALSNLNSGNRSSESLRATIEDVAKEAQVSTATISRVINGTGRVSENTRRRVLTAIRELNYIPHGAARDLARRKKQIVGLVIPGTITPYYSSLLNGIDKSLTNRGYSLLIYVNHNHDQLQQVDEVGYETPELGEHNTDGLLIFTDSVADNMIMQLHQHGFPMVLFHRMPPENIDIPCITLDNRTGVRELMKHLIENCGHRRIAHLRGPENNMDAQEREATYCQSLLAYGIQVDPQLIGEGNFTSSAARNTVSKWLEEGLEFDAIFAGDDNAAVGVMTALRSAGKRIPEDVAVVGFNDDQMAAYLSPPLTTLRTDTEGVGFQAAEQLIRQIKGESTESIIQLPTQLIIRESCGYHLRLV